MTVNVTDQPRVILTGLVFPESPRWHDGRLWLVDMHAHKVLTVGLDGHSAVAGEFDDRPSALGFLPDGVPVVALARKRLIVRLDAARQVHADLSRFPGDDLNDMVVDRAGGIYIDNRLKDRPGADSIVLITPAGDCRHVAEALHSPNGLVITPDASTFIVAESRGHRLLAFDIQRDGTLTNRREWARTATNREPEEGRDPSPDGICLDAGGGVWLGSPRTWEFLRIEEGGRVTHRLGLPAEHRAVACALGDRDRRTLFLLMAETSEENLKRCRGNFEAERRSTARGWVGLVRVDLPGVGWP